MNRAQAADYEPTGAGLRWTVQELAKPRKKWVPPRVDKSARRGAQPQVRAPYAQALWKAICEATRPITKSAWIKRAGIPQGYERQLSVQAIKNLVNGHWVKEMAGGKYRRVQA